MEGMAARQLPHCVVISHVVYEANGAGLFDAFHFAIFHCSRETHSIPVINATL